MNASRSIREEIIRNGQEITRLQQRVHEMQRKSQADRRYTQDWLEACEAFRSRYDALAFPGGESTAYERILQNDPAAVEAALCFLECRPYFFRSGYMWKKLFRKIKHATLTGKQQHRLDALRQEWQEYRARRIKAVSFRSNPPKPHL